MIALRTNSWLAGHLQELRTQFFADVPLPNVVQVRFGRLTRSRLGSITTRKLKGKAPISLITLNGLFRRPEVPVYVLDAVLAHEFVHYSHGWHSPLPRLYRHPHRDGIVDRDLIKRGMGEILERQKHWVKQEFAPLYLAEYRRSKSSS